MAHYAFDQGITHFDLANNYGPSYGSAEETFGMIMKKSFMPYRDELFISTKAGHDMWPGPYGEWGSRKYLMNSLNQSLKRMNLDYVDIFYSHRYDPETPLEETLQALVDLVRQGKWPVCGYFQIPERSSRIRIPLSGGEGCALPALSGKIQYVQPGTGRRRYSATGTRKRYRFHCLFTAGTRPADQPLSEWYPRRFADCQRWIPEERSADKKKCSIE